MATSAFGALPSIWMPNFFKWDSGVDNHVSYPDTGYIDTSGLQYVRVDLNWSSHAPDSDTHVMGRDADGNLIPAATVIGDYTINFDGYIVPDATANGHLVIIYTQLPKLFRPTISAGALSASGSSFAHGYGNT